MALYRGGMTGTASRIAAGGNHAGQCRDTFRGGKQIRLTEMVRQLAVESLGMTDVDKFHLLLQFLVDRRSVRASKGRARQLVRVIWVFRK